MAERKKHVYRHPSHLPGLNCLLVRDGWDTRTKAAIRAELAPYAGEIEAALAATPSHAPAAGGQGPRPPPSSRSS